MPGNSTNTERGEQRAAAPFDGRAPETQIVEHELTDKMESEDLTQFLNHYLTEMSAIALEFGATIDKYVGDAIVMFFGDPESRGVKENARACVRMSPAMQRRIAKLIEEWRDSGIETPPRCRIGIHTGYCTVGNFGSEDRMEYTIVGGAVNLASRLERESNPGGVLISSRRSPRCETRSIARSADLSTSRESRIRLFRTKRSRLGKTLQREGRFERARCVGALDQMRRPERKP